MKNLMKNVHIVAKSECCTCIMTKDKNKRIIRNIRLINRNEITTIATIVNRYIIQFMIYLHTDIAGIVAFVN